VMECRIRWRTMNAPSEIVPDRDQANLEYDRLKPLRELEQFALEGRTKMAVIGPIISTTVILFMLELNIASGQFPHNIFLRGLSTLVIVAALSGIWISYVWSASKERWALMAKLLRILAEEVTELRAAKR
jgi:hypothetical protein